MMNQIGLHLTYSEHKGFRVYTIRILMMVPIYSITSYCGLHNPSNAIIWAMIRDMYECVVLASFLQYCLTYLGGPENLARYLMAKQLSDEVKPSTVESPRKKARKQFFADSDNSDTDISDSDSISSPRASYSKKKKIKKEKPTHAHHVHLFPLFFLLKTPNSHKPPSPRFVGYGVRVAQCGALFKECLQGRGTWVRSSCDCRCWAHCSTSRSPSWSQQRGS